MIPHARDPSGKAVPQPAFTHRVLLASFAAGHARAREVCALPVGRRQARLRLLQISVECRVICGGACIDLGSGANSQANGKRRPLAPAAAKLLCPCSLFIA